MSEHGIHSLSYAGCCILHSCSLMTIAWTTYNIGMKTSSKIRRSVMTTHNTSCFQRFCDLGVQLFIPSGNTRVVHDFSQANHTRPTHCLSHFSGSQLCSTGLQFRCRWNTRRNLNIDLHRSCRCFINYQPYAGESKDVSDFVWIGKYSSCPMRQNCSRKLGDCEHRAFYMHVCVK